MFVWNQGKCQVSNPFLQQFFPLEVLFTSKCLYIVSTDTGKTTTAQINMFLTDLILVAIYIGLVVMIKKPCKHKQVDIYYWSQVDTLMKSKARAWQSCHKIRIFNWPLLNIQPIKVTTNLCEVLQGHILCKTENTIYMKVLL